MAKFRRESSKEEDVVVEEFGRAAESRREGWEEESEEASDVGEHEAECNLTTSASFLCCDKRVSRCSVWRFSQFMFLFVLLSSFFLLDSLVSIYWCQLVLLLFAIRVD